MKSFIKYIVLFVFSFLAFDGFAQPTITNIEITDVAVCNGDASGQFIIHATGDAPFAYSIKNGDAGTFFTSNVFTGLYAGTYTIVVKDAYGVQTNTHRIINEPPAMHISAENKINVTGCYGNNNGEISITASGGVGAFTYSINTPTNFLLNGGNFTGLFAGTYQVKVQDANGCIKDGSTIIINQPSEITITAGANNVLGCHGDDTGSIEINASGGTSPLEYSINGAAGTWQSNKHFSNLAPGNYQAIVKDAAGCFSSEINLTITEPDELIISSEQVIDVSTCYGEATGGITIIATGGTGTLLYTIGGSYETNGGVFTGLFAGTYTIEVLDEKNCHVNGNTVTVNQPSSIVISSETSNDNDDVTSCFGDATGTIDIVASGGIAPLEYSVDGGTSWNISSSFLVPAGSYQTFVRDANSCYTTGQNHIVTQPAELLITDVNTTDVTTCFGGNNGTLSIVTNGGGTPAYEFSINNGAYFTQYNVNNLSAGIYEIIVNDSHNCKDTFENIIIGEPTQVMIDSVKTYDPLCHGETNGSIEVFASGGIGQLVYSSDGGNIFTNGNILYGLSANTTYNIAVKDDHGCTTFGSNYTLGQPNKLIIDSIVKEDVNDCFGGDNGSITIHAHGGTPNIQYSINAGQNYQASNIFPNLPASTNFIIIKDGNNCSTPGGNITITQPEQINISYQSFKNIEGCNGATIGEIHFDVNGGTMPYTYSIVGTQNISNTSGDFLNLPAGQYNISVIDKNNCSATGNEILITEPNILTVSVQTYNDIDCFGNTNGNISLTATGGEFTYQYSIDGGATYQSSTFFSNLNAANYQTYVKDSYGCEKSGINQTISEPTDLIINSVSFDNINDCFGDDDGTITINVSGGVPFHTGEYLYSNNLGGNWQSNNGNYTNLSPGNYYIQVRDSNLCEKTFLDANFDIDTITITEPLLLKPDSINTSHIKCYNDNDGIIDAYASGGTGGIKYSIDNGANYPNVDNDGYFDGLSAGDYLVKMKDANACETNSYSISIYEPDLLYIVNVTYEDEQCLGNNDGTITIYGNGGVRPFQFSIDGINFQSNKKIENLAPGTYSPILRDTNLCLAYSDPVTIGSPTNQSLFSTDVSEGCSPLGVQFNRLNEGFTYLWEFGDGETSNHNEPFHIFNNISDATINYTITAYSQSLTGCKDTTEIIITVFPQPHLDFSVSPIVTYFPETTKNITNNSPSGYINYFWDFDDEQTSIEENPISHTYETCGEYQISVYAENSFACSDTAFETVKILTHLPQARFLIDTTEHCVPYTFYFENQSFNTDTFEWILDDGTIVYDNNISQYIEEDGVYNITLIAFGFCNTKDTLEQTITVHQTPVVDFEAFPDTVMLPGQPIHCYNWSSADAESFFWEFGDGGTSSEENPTYQYTQEGTYSIQLTVLSENKCIDSLMLSSEVIVLPAGRLVFPTAFSPNSNGENDIFKPAVYFSVETFKMEVFNRWGEQVFYTEDIETGWTGAFNGKKSMQDVYVWRAEGKYVNGTPFEMSGSITLLR